MHTFARESIKDCIDEAYPLLYEHWQSIAHYKDIELDPAVDEYINLEKAGIIRCFTVRTEFRKLIGYGVYFVRPNLHYRSSIQAVQDILYIDPHFRGIGKEFINWCDEQLRSEGVQCVYQHVKLAFDFGAMLKRLGYEAIETIYGRRLDK